MPRYMVHSSETVYYATIVEADSEAEALLIVTKTGEVGEIVDGDNCEIEYAELIED